MNETSSFQSPSGNAGHGAFIPLMLMGVALCILLAWQLVLTWNSRATLRGQFEQRKELVAQSEAVQNNVQNLVNDLLNLAATDAEAQKIVEKYNIRRNLPTQ